jgi:hypothetical protein
MKSYVVAGLLVVGLARPAFAASLATRDANDTAQNYSYAAKHHYAVEDTVGAFSVIDARPSADLKILGDKSGYDSIAAAQKSLNSDSSQCKGIIQRV